MKTTLFSLAAAIFMIFPGLCAAQDIPVPAEEIPAPVDQTASATTTELPADTAETPENTANAEQIKSPEKIAGEQLIAFFQGMIDSVNNAEGDCKAMADAMHNYYEKHSAYIENLDYSTTNISTEDIHTIHDMAIAFGKNLSSCYDEKSIPSLLRQYANLGSEW